MVRPLGQACPVHRRWRPLGPGAARGALHAHRHATRVRKTRNAAPASVLDRSAAPSAAEEAPQQGQGRQNGAPASRLSGWRTAGGVLHYTGDASEPGSQPEGAVAARSTSLAAPASSGCGWALVRWEDPSASAGASGDGTPRAPPDAAAATPGSSAAGVGELARSQESARAQGQGGSKRRRRTWLQQPTRAATVTWVVGDGGARPQQAELQSAGADLGLRGGDPAQQDAVGEAAAAQSQRASASGTALEGPNGAGALGTAGEEQDLASGGAEQREPLPRPPPPAGGAASVLQAVAPGAAEPGSQLRQAAAVLCADPAVEAAPTDGLPAVAEVAAPEPAPDAQARSGSVVVDDLIALQRNALDARSAAASARPRVLCADAAPAAAALSEALLDPAYGAGLGLGDLAPLAAGGGGPEGAGPEGSERAGAWADAQSSTRLVPEEGPRALEQAAGKAAGRDAAQLPGSVAQQAAEEAAAEGTPPATGEDGAAQSMQDAPPLGKAGFAVQARSAELVRWYPGADASADGASEQAGGGALDAVDEAPASGSSVGAELDRVQGPGAEADAAAEAVVIGILDAGSAGAAADTEPAVTVEVSDAAASEAGTSGLESDASAISGDSEPGGEGGTVRTEARRAKESLLRRSHSDKELEQQVSPVQRLPALRWHAARTAG